MGTYDYLKCDYPLPHKEAQDAQFQTKGFICRMDNYTITKEGRAIWHRVRHEEVPEEERPYYGKPEWAEELYPGFFPNKLEGSYKTIPIADIDIYEHGSIRFYMDIKAVWYEYEAIFEDGQLVKLITISPKPTIGKIIEITNNYGADTDDIVVYIESGKGLIITGLHISKCRDFVPNVGDEVNIVDDEIVPNN